MSLTTLSPMMGRIQPSPTFQLSQKVQRMNQDGADMIDLTLGEPNFPTPVGIGQAAIEAIRQGDTQYPPVAGTRALRRAIQSYYQTQHNLVYDLNQIMVGNGAKQVIFNALMATLCPGERVVVPAPYWVSYIDMIQGAGGTPHVVACSEAQGFKLKPQQLDQALQGGARWVILNSPNNPTGAVYTSEEGRRLGDVLERYPDVLVLSDDIYDWIRYDGEPPTTLVKICPSLKERTLIVHGVSKAFAMTGWRVGYGLGPEWLIQAMTTVQSQSTSGVCTIAQAAAVDALQGPKTEVKAMVHTYHERRDLFLQALRTIPGLTCSYQPLGAFYLYVNCGVLLERTGLSTDQEAADWLLESARVACVPGTVFGLSPYLRFSYALATPQLHEALERIAQACRT